MLDPWIIEQIRRREEEQRRRDERPVIELPLEDPMREERSQPESEIPVDDRDAPKRGVVIIHYAV